ncbi:MAG TPA: anhydro-N-acetylmuramic acid kinase [Rhodospirillaceae bacterium]|jgi:anhydro-N-acetylmuramic acid kinase|nr:anhydro-N-acetylmuramic acid kinase [Alphaproteobacteria bacterium]HBH27038.1 anhydro-N-acetylmuramic acid kinase [Rhodospirillaceae bacterium]
MYTALGFMSGTSLDGVDAAVVETDGRGHVRPLASAHAPYAPSLRRALGACLGQRAAPPAVVQALTAAHLNLFRRLGHRADVIGFPGQTTHHDPESRTTVQIGDAAWLARQTGCAVIADFRRADVEAGGQGAPLIPLYHQALAAALPKPLAILNLGGVGNATSLQADALDAWDTGPGGALLDDFVAQRTGQPYDAGGALAARGTPDESLLRAWLAHPYFARPPPKSLDRNTFAHCLADAARLSTPDGAATLAAFTARAARHIPLPGPLYVTGGGRKNAHILGLLGAQPVEALGWDGDTLEAQGLAYLAVRSLLKLPLTLPSTTGAPRPLTGGQKFAP